MKIYKRQKSTVDREYYTQITDRANGAEVSDLTLVSYIVASECINPNKDIKHTRSSRCLQTDLEKLVNAGLLITLQNISGKTLILHLNFDRVKVQKCTGKRFS